jgi:hypothetical protein
MSTRTRRNEGIDSRKGKELSGPSTRDLAERSNDMKDDEHDASSQDASPPLGAQTHVAAATTGMAADDPAFEKRWTAFLRQLGPRLKSGTESAAVALPESPGRQHSEGVNAHIP